jgi:hypothetical protein
MLSDTKNDKLAALKTTTDRQQASGNTDKNMISKIGASYRAAFAAFIIGWAVFAFPWLSGQVTIPYDAKAHFQAQIQFLANAIHTGQSPFWTHNVFGGSPQIADPQSLIFSPAYLLAYLEAAPSLREVDLYCFLLLALAGLSVILFFRDRGWHPGGAVVAALATAFGGSSIWRIQHVKQIESFAFFMLTLWLLARALDRKSLLYGIFAGLAACTMIIEPGQVSMLGCYVLAGYTVHHWLSQPRFWTSVRQTLPALLAGGLVASVLAAVPIVLSFLFVLDSNRPEIPFKEAEGGSLHPASLLTAIIPDIFSVRWDLPYWGPGSPDWRVSWLALCENMGQVYIGALPVLLLLAVGIARGRLWSRDIRFFTIAIAVLLLYALGRFTVFFAWAYEDVPGVDLFRRPADATYALGAMVSVASGYFLHLLLTGKEAVPDRQRYGVVAALAALFATGLCVAAAHDHLSSAVTPVLVSAGIFTGGLLLLSLARRYVEDYGALTVAALAAFMTLDLALGNGANRDTALPPSAYSELLPDTHNETVGFLKKQLNQGPGSMRRDRVELVGLGFEWPNIGLIQNFDHVLGYNPLRLGEIVDAIGASETVAEARQRQFTPLFPSYRSTMADLLGLRYIAANQPLETIDTHLKPGDLTLVARTKDAYIYENPRALPRAIFADDWLPADFERMTKDGRWPLFDPGHIVLLRQPPPKPRKSLGMPVAQTRAAMLMRTYANTEIEIEITAPQPGFLVLNDIWHPWWFGTVDGEPAEILRANVLFRAIQVPAGKHIVRMEFRPVEGAAKEIEARLQGHSPEPGAPAPIEPHPRPEASARDLLPSGHAGS